MVIYNVTVNIEESIHDEWLKWMREQHIPDVMGTGLFIKNRILRVLNDEEDGYTYSIQYYSQGMKEVEQYREIFAPALQAEHSEKFRNKFVAFRTLLEVVE